MVTRNTTGFPLPIPPKAPGLTEWPNTQVSKIQNSKQETCGKKTTGKPAGKNTISGLKNWDPKEPRRLWSKMGFYSSQPIFCCRKGLHLKAKPTKKKIRVSGPAWRAPNWATDRWIFGPFPYPIDLDLLILIVHQFVQQKCRRLNCFHGPTNGDVILEPPKWKNFDAKALMTSMHRGVQSFAPKRPEGIVDTAGRDPKRIGLSLFYCYIFPFCFLGNWICWKVGVSQLTLVTPTSSLPSIRGSHCSPPERWEAPLHAVVDRLRCAREDHRSGPSSLMWSIDPLWSIRSFEFAFDFFDVLAWMERAVADRQAGRPMRRSSTWSHAHGIWTSSIGWPSKCSSVVFGHFILASSSWSQKPWSTS